MRQGDSIRIEINGVEYRSLDDVPDELRAQVAGILADADGDGVPDIVQGPDAALSVSSTREETFIVDGVAYSSIDEIPEPHRSTMARLADPTLSRPSQPDQRAHPMPTADTARPRSIVTNAGLSGRTKMLLAFAVAGAVVIGAVVWLFLR